MPYHTGVFRISFPSGCDCVERPAREAGQKYFQGNGCKFRP